MGNYRDRDRGGRPDTHRNSFNRGRFGGGSRFGDRDSGRGRRDNFQKTEVTCSKCGKECTVPFRPTSGKPVYCSECFGGNSKSRSSSPVSSISSSGISSEQFDKINKKLDRIIEILESIEVVEDEEESEEQ